MKKLYLDYNIIIELKRNTITLENLSIGDTKGIYYSPAHIEEVAVSAIEYGCDEQIVKEDLEFISELTENKKILPHHGEIYNYNKGIYIKEEHPFVCYKRVINSYNRNKYAENGNREVLETSKENEFFGNKPMEINNVKAEEILKKQLDEVHINIKEMFIFHYNCHIENFGLDRLKKHFFTIDDFKDNFIKMNIIFEMLANILEASGFYYEKAKKARSRMHDVSHIIYGSNFDKFITADKKLFSKAKAIYSYLNIKTEVYYYNQKEKKLEC